MPEDPEGLGWSESHVDGGRFHLGIVSCGSSYPLVKSKNSSSEIDSGKGAQHGVSSAKLLVEERKEVGEPEALYIRKGRSQLVRVGVSQRTLNVLASYLSAIKVGEDVTMVPASTALDRTHNTLRF